MPLKFVVTSGSTGKFAFSVMARNGRVIANSDEYSSRAAALSGVRSLQTQAADAAIEDHSTKAWAAAEQGRQTEPAAAKTTKTTKKAAKKRAVKPEAAAAAPEPEAEAEAEPSSQPVLRAASFAEPDLADAGPQRVSLRSQPGEVPDGHTRRVVSMRNRS